MNFITNFRASKFGAFYIPLVVATLPVTLTSAATRFGRVKANKEGGYIGASLKSAGDVLTGGVITAYENLMTPAPTVQVVKAGLDTVKKGVTQEHQELLKIMASDQQKILGTLEVLDKSITSITDDVNAMIGVVETLQKTVAAMQAMQSMPAKPVLPTNVVG